MPMDDREQQFERALARLLRDASPESHCPDAETLSAYHERSLSEAQMTHFKEHISGCARCQEILTLVEQSEEVPAEEWDQQKKPAEVYDEKAPAFFGAAAEPWPQSASRTLPAAPSVAVMPEKSAGPRWRWLIPVGALAACAIAAVGIREIQMQHRKEAAATRVQMAKNQEPTQQATAPFSVPSGQQSMQQLNQQQHQAQALDKATRDQKQGMSAAPKKVTPPAAITPRSDGSVVAPRDDTALARPEEALPPAAARMAAPETSDVATVERERHPEAPKVPAPAPSAVAGAAEQAAPEPKAKNAAPNVPPVGAQTDSLSATVSRAAVPVNGLAANLLEAAAADRRYVVAPGMTSVWRVGDAGKIERSSDRGKTWKEESSGVSADLTAGSATSDKVCWVVGKNGTILLSVDGGKSWKPVTAPITGDIGGIHASDALHATVWDVANRASYETSDGGASWNRVANQ